MTNVDAINAKSPKLVRKVTRTHNQKVSTKSFGAFFLELAESKVKSDVGSIKAVATQEQMLSELAIEYAKAIEAKTPLRDCMLTFWHRTPEGAKWKKVRDAIPRGQKASETQSSLATDMRMTENALANQLSRALDCYFGVRILRNQKRMVHFAPIGRSGNYACYVRAEKVLGEQTNEVFNVKALKTLSTVEKSFTERTPTAAVLTIISKANNKKNTANKSKGGADEALSPALIGRTLRQIDTALSPLAGNGRIEGVSKTTRETCHMVWARIGAGMSDVEKADAIAAFDKLAAPKDKKVRKVA